MKNVLLLSVLFSLIVGCNTNEEKETKKEVDINSEQVTWKSKFPSLWDVAYANSPDLSPESVTYTQFMSDVANKLKMDGKFIEATKGDKGDTGAQGIQGLPGSQGEQGIAGVDGLNYGQWEKWIDKRIGEGPIPQPPSYQGINVYKISYANPFDKNKCQYLMGLSSWRSNLEPFASDEEFKYYRPSVDLRDTEGLPFLNFPSDISEGLSLPSLKNSGHLRLLRFTNSGISIWLSETSITPIWHIGYFYDSYAILDNGDSAPRQLNYQQGGLLVNEFVDNKNANIRLKVRCLKQITR